MLIPFPFTGCLCKYSASIKGFITSLFPFKYISRVPRLAWAPRWTHHTRLVFGIVHVGVEQHSGVIVRRPERDGQSIAAILQGQTKNM